jgi:hypothetical protein
MASPGARSRPVLAVVSIVALASVLVRAAHAEVRVEGAIESVRLEARDASVRETLDALSGAFGLRVRNAAALEQRVNGTYQGSLQQVVAQLLTGRNYVAIHSGGSLEIRIFGDGGSQPIAGPPSAPIYPSNVATAPPQAPSSMVDKARRLFIPR